MVLFCVSDAVGPGGIAARLRDGDGRVVAIVDIVVREEIVVPAALRDSEGRRNRAAVAFDYVVLNYVELGRIGVVIGVGIGMAD